MSAYKSFVLVNHEGVVISPELTRLDDAEDGSWRFGYLGGEIDSDDSKFIKNLCESGSYSLEPYDRDKHSWQVLRGSALYEAGLHVMVDIESYSPNFSMTTYPEFPENPDEVEREVRKLYNDLSSVLLKLDRARMAREG